MSALAQCNVINRWVGYYLGLPYKEKGRDRQGLDDWGLYRLVIAEQFGIALPSFAKEPDEWIVQDLIENFARTEIYQAPHAALIRPTLGTCLVIGTCVGNNQALTIDRQTKKSFLVRLSDFEHRIYRYRTWQEVQGG